ncbi:MULTISPECIES: sigma-54-dependent transcriptional regulator [Sphingomonas]|uniref:sigma-54-dependent transcriptional regulator n=1 Tax=Sphingomonas TaxID=13687 RepID=UPI001F071523|nr:MULTISPECIES: sigma-54 dependent transcriptional regulator [Sphingomonas]
MSVIDQPVFVVEDDPELCAAVLQALDLAGLPAQAFPNAEAALGALTGLFDGVVVSDVRMPGMDGLQLLGRVHSIDRDIPLILMTGHGDVPMAVQALKLGAYDFITKPFAIDHLLAVIGRALEKRALQIENRRLRAAAEASDASSPLIGASLVMARLRSLVRELAAADIDVLVEGETGVGKEVVAQLLHRLGPRAGRPFIPVNCAADDETRLGQALFGVSSATGAGLPRSQGQIAAANSGTLLLDEIEGLPLPLQARLLRVMEEGELQLPGAERPDIINVRVVATAKPGLEQTVERGAFRADLYHRLTSARLRIPPLRERQEDALLLFDLFVREARERRADSNFVADAAMLEHVRQHPWPGNVRELRNFAMAAVFGHGDDPHAVDGSTADRSLKSRLATFERSEIVAAIRQAGGNIGLAIKRLGLARKTFYDRVERLGIDLTSERRKSRDTQR